jgi:hypothetical protein
LAILHADDKNFRIYKNNSGDLVLKFPNIVRVIKSRRIRWAKHVARMGEGRGVYRVFIGRPEGKRPMGRHRRRGEGNIKMELSGTGLGWLRIGFSGELL